MSYKLSFVRCNHFWDYVKGKVKCIKCGIRPKPVKKSKHGRVKG